MPLEIDTKFALTEVELISYINVDFHAERYFPVIWIHFSQSYSAVGKIANTWNISGIFIVLRPITAQTETHELVTKI